jgi:hypothetical protein
LPSGLAHVATASFLASRAAPSGGFWIALAGGAALARAGSLRGARVGYGASLAAMIESVAVMGPPRFGVPLTQAITAPLLGQLEQRGRSALSQIVICAAIRLLQTAAFVAFFIVVLAGGVDAYTDSYDAIARFLPLLPEGTEAALAFTAATLLAWAAFASTVQVLVYRRSLRAWPESPEPTARVPASVGEPENRRRYDPRAVALASLAAFIVLLASTDWAVLAAVAAWLALAWGSARADRDVVPAGVTIAATLAAGVLVFSLIGGGSLDFALRRTCRAGLLVLVATWLRAAAGAPGLREVSRRVLHRVRRLPSVPEASRVLDELGAERELGNAANSVIASVRAVPKRPMPVLDAVLGWVALEAGRFRATRATAAPRLRLRPPDALLLALTAGPIVALLLT